MELSIIIVNYKSPNLIRKQLEYFINLKINLDYEIIIVDNESTNETSLLIKNFLVLNSKISKLVISKKNVGYFGGVNLGLKHAKGKHILILNTDIIPEEGSIEVLYNFLETNKNAGVVGPKLLYPDKTIQSSCFRFYNLLTPFLRRTILGSTDFGRREIYKIFMQDFDHNEIIEVDWLLGAAIMVNRDILNEIGGLDERYFLYYEDMDLCKACWKNKKKVIYLPNIYMIHDHQRFSAKIKGVLDIFLNKVFFIHIKSAIKYTFKFLCR